MKIKKPANAGGATIADRLKLDPAQSSAAAPQTGKQAATVALCFGLVALAVVVILVFTLYKHWEFLSKA